MEIYRYLFEEVAEERKNALKQYLIQSPDKVIDKRKADAETIALMTKWVTSNADRLIRDMEDADPTDTGKYIQWIIKTYIRPIIGSGWERGYGFINQKIDEDMYKVKQYLEWFNSNKADLKRRGLETDIMKYNSVQDLFKSVSVYKDSSPKEEAEELPELLTNRYYIDTNQVDVIVDDGNYLVVRLKSYEASKFYGCLTEWCTAFPNHYKNYSGRGFLFVILDKHFIEQSKVEEEGSPIPENTMVQVFLSFDGAEIESRDIYDGWNSDAVEVYNSYKSNFDNYLRQSSEYTYDPESSSVATIHRDGYSLVPNEDGFYWATFKDWSDVSYLVGREYSDFASDVLVGDAYEHFNHDYAYEDLNGIYIKGNEMTPDVEKDLKALLKTRVTDNDPEVLEAIDDIEDISSDFGKFMGEYSGDYDMDDIKIAVLTAYAETKAQADEGEAYNEITKHIADQMDVSGKLEYKDNQIVGKTRKRVPEKSLYPDYINTTLFSDESEEEEEYDNWVPPYYGFSGDVLGEYFSEALGNQLSMI